MSLPRLSADASPAEVDLLMEQAKKASHLLRSLSHETRLIILCLLTERELSVSEIEQILQLPQATVSQQLARLRLDGLVIARREGRLIFYRIADTDVSKIIESLYDLFCKPVRQPPD